jgi:hypothetical protein
MNVHSLSNYSLTRRWIDRPLAKTFGVPPDNAKAGAEGALLSHKQAGLGHGKGMPRRLVDRLTSQDGVPARAATDEALYLAAAQIARWTPLHMRSIAHKSPFP